LRVEILGAGVETTNGVSYSDPMGDTAPGDVSAVDLTAVRAFLGCQAGLPKLRCIEMDLAGNLQDPRPLPEEAWYGWGIVLDVDSDGIPDYRYGVDNSDPGVGPSDGGQR